MGSNFASATASPLPFPHFRRVMLAQHLRVVVDHFVRKMSAPVSTRGSFMTLTISSRLAHRQAGRTKLRTMPHGNHRRKIREEEKPEVSCKDRPVCEHFYLHSFRKSCATRWHEAGIPIRTIQNWLGHKSLEAISKPFVRRS
jgi:integrase